VVIPHLPPEYRPGNEKFGEVIEGAKLLGRKAKELGMQLAYHNHDFEFVKIDGEYALDILYKEVSADILETELDTCWVNVGGEDPAAYIRKYSGRVNILHLKDFVGQKSDNMYGLIGVKDSEKKEAPTKFEYRPVGFGKQDFPGILKAAKESGTKWVVVEQDMPSMGKTPMECAQMSIEYLNHL
jgi:sugar phosphate isomerase/epimerase